MQKPQYYRIFINVIHQKGEMRHHGRIAFYSSPDKPSAEDGKSVIGTKEKVDKQIKDWKRQYKHLTELK